MRILVIIIILSVHGTHGFAQGNYTDAKRIELEECLKITMQAKARIRAASTTRAGDFLKLLPGITISRHAPYSDIPESETYFGATFSTSSIFEIVNKSKDRKVLKRKALRKVQSTGFIIKKLINKKYLIKERIWKFNQMRRSMDNPVDVAGIDEKIDALELSLQEIEIDIEARYAEIEYVCVEVEG